MEKRKYTEMQALEAEIVIMHEEGKTQREIAEHLGLERSQVKKMYEEIPPQARVAPGRMVSLHIKARRQSLRDCGWRTS